jgi:murein DD-endopeptidase MepM/ murein hydrolase activator NlpD
MLTATMLIANWILGGKVVIPDLQIISKQAMAATAQEASRPEVKEYTVRPGDTLWAISNKYGVNIETIVRLNNLKDPNCLSIGQKLKIITTDGVVYAVSRGDSLWRISSRYGVTVDEIVKANSLKNPNQLQIGQKLIIPEKAVKTMAATTASTGSSALGVSLRWPVKGILSSPYGPRWGRFHAGIDIAASKGTNVCSAAPGTVVSAGWLGDYGYTVLIDHGRGIRTRYAHFTKINVKKGQRVSTATVLGTVGSTGRSTGPHLHFEVIVNGKTQDPLKILPIERNTR